MNILYYSDPFKLLTTDAHSLLQDNLAELAIHLAIYLD